MQSTIKVKTFSATNLLLIIFILFSFQACEKSVLDDDKTILNSNNAAGSKKPKNQPPPPPPFYFNNCSSPLYAASLVKGAYANITVSKNYINSPGGSYSAFTSAVVNGITVSAPAGTFNTGSGTIVFTVTGTPVNTGIFSISVSIGNIIPCAMNFAITNAPASGPDVDPGNIPGSTGVVNFLYRGQPVAYTTVRAKDGRIWLQQNLGSPQVAFHEMDQSSYGDYFQWGRWDDGHQVSASMAITGSSALQNPSHIAGGNSMFIKGTTSSTRWWGTGGVETDTWSGTTVTVTNGKDPCAALGIGWRLPSAAEWSNLIQYEDLFGTLPAFQSNLKILAAGYRNSGDGGTFNWNGDFGYYWSGSAATNSTAKVLLFDNVYNAGVTTANRAEGFPCRCIKE